MHMSRARSLCSWGVVCPDQAKTEVGTLVGSAPAARLKVGGKLLGHVMPNMMPVQFYHIGQTRDTERGRERGRGRERERGRGRGRKRERETKRVCVCACVCVCVERKRQRACVCVYVYVNHDVQAYIQVKQHPHYRFWPMAAHLIPLIWRNPLSFLMFDGELLIQWRFLHVWWLKMVALSVFGAKYRDDNLF